MDWCELSAAQGVGGSIAPWRLRLRAKVIESHAREGKSSPSRLPAALDEWRDLNVAGVFKQRYAFTAMSAGDNAFHTQSNRDTA